MTILVRRSVVADDPALRALFLASRSEAFFWQPDNAFQLQDFDAQTQGELLWVAEDGARLVGFIAVWEPEKFIHHMYVDGQLARRGVGRALLRALPGWPATRYRLKCLQRNELAQAFYRACRFVEIGAGIADDGAYLVLESSGEDA